MTGSDDCGNNLMINNIERRIKVFRSEKLFNDSWEFQLVREGESYREDRFIPVELPHDWLIYDCDNLYEDGTGYYRKSFKLDKKTEKRYFINFDGVYMDSTIYVNSLEVGVNRYGYSPFEFESATHLKSTPLAFAFFRAFSTVLLYLIALE